MFILYGISLNLPHTNTRNSKPPEQMWMSNGTIRINFAKRRKVGLRYCGSKRC